MCLVSSAAAVHPITAECEHIVYTFLEMNYKLMLLTYGFVLTTYACFAYYIVGNMLNVLTYIPCIDEADTF